MHALLVKKNVLYKITYLHNNKASDEDKPEQQDKHQTSTGSEGGGGWTQRVKGWFSSVRVFVINFLSRELLAYTQAIRFFLLCFYV